MDLRLLYAVFLTLMPVSELRGGLPLAVIYALDNDIPLVFVFCLIVLVNIFLIFFIFYFLDKLHHGFMNLKFYRKFFEKYLKGFQKKVDKFEGKYATLGFLALVLFVAVPLPGTGAWGGGLLSWLLGLDRQKSVLSIALGVIIAGLFVFLGTLGLISFLS